MALSPPPSTVPTSTSDLTLLTAIHNEKCKATAAFLYNLSAAIVITGVIANVIQHEPKLDPILFLLTATFASIFFAVGSNSLNQMKS